MQRAYPLRDLASMVNAQLIGAVSPISVEHLAIDSRKPLDPANTLFFALPGDRHDGHTYIPELIERGVKAFVVSHAPAPDLQERACFLVVPDPLGALQRIAALHREGSTIPVIGITGSNGKTIVKEWLYQMLRSEEHIVRSPGSWNSQVGVPLSVWEMDGSHTLGIFEAGISKRGEMELLAPIIAPTIGVLTTIGPAHGEGFADDVEKTREKCALFKSAQAVVCCTDQPVVRDAMAELHPPVLRNWSRTGEAFVQVLNEQVLTNATELVVLHNGSQHRFMVPFTDRASVDNAITCITVLMHLQKEPSWINDRLQSLEPVEMRLRTMEGLHGSTLIDDSYSNDLASLGIALEHQARIAHGRQRIVVIGDIAESALEPAKLYANVASQLTLAGVDQLFAVGPRISAQRAAFPVTTQFFKNTNDLLRDVDPAVFGGAVVLVKGARSLHLESAVQRWQHQVHGTELEIDLEAIRTNLNFYRTLLSSPLLGRGAGGEAFPRVRIMAMVKAFGYGSGAVELARLFAHERVDYLGVAYADEGIELRQRGIDLPILVMNPEPVPHETLHRSDLEAELYDQVSLHEAIDFARTLRKPLRVHLKLDTGMHRLGFMESELPALLSELKDAPLKIMSIFSHLAASEDPQQDAFTKQQIARFASMCDAIDEILGYRPLRHIANSAGISRFPEAHFDMVRLGIGLHGIGNTPAESAQLVPTATLRTVIAQIKGIPTGDSVGYGRQATVKNPTRIAILPIGYADGFSRRLGNGQGRVWIAGKEARTIGNICMDMCMVDVTDIPCRSGEEVIIFNREHGLAEYAKDLGTIPYEALTSIAQRVKRVYVKG